MRGACIIISGGGTAGHLYPALAVGRKLKEKAPEVNLVYVGSSRNLEKRLMEHHQARFVPLKIEGIKGRGWKSLRALVYLPFAFLRSLFLILRTKPRLVIGAGGYSSGPIVLLAAWMRIPTLIMEQNLRPGFTNRLLRRWVRRVVVSFEGTLPFFKGKGVYIGNPVRDAFYRLTPKEKKGRLVLLIFGGSQGSHFLNTVMVEALSILKEERERIRIFHQTGEKDLAWVRESYLREGFREVIVSSYFHDMAERFREADLVICRAGASTVAELIAARKASLLVPFAGATEEHQLLNARELEKTGGAVVVQEAECRPELLAEKIREFLGNCEKLKAMEKKLALLRTENAAERIADLCLELMHRQSKE